jgi:hypothetical protein
MSTGIGCINRTSALRRPPPIADGFALRRQWTSWPLHHHRIPPPILAIPPRRDVGRRSSGKSASSRPPATRQIPIAA